MRNSAGAGAGYYMTPNVPETRNRPSGRIVQRSPGKHISDAADRSVLRESQVRRGRSFILLTLRYTIETPLQPRSHVPMHRGPVRRV